MSRYREYQEREEVVREALYRQERMKLEQLKAEKKAAKMKDLEARNVLPVEVVGREEAKPVKSVKAQVKEGKNVH